MNKPFQHPAPESSCSETRWWLGWNCKQITVFVCLVSSRCLWSQNRLRFPLFWKNTASRVILSLAGIWRTTERLHELSKIFVEHAWHVVRIQFRTGRPNSCALGTVGRLGLVWPSGFSINGCSYSIKPVDERKQDGLVQNFGVREHNQAELPFLLPTQEEDRKKLCSVRTGIC